MRKALIALLIVGVVLVAGCIGGMGEKSTGEGQTGTSPQTTAGGNQGTTGESPAESGGTVSSLEEIGQRGHVELFNQSGLVGITVHVDGSSWMSNGNAYNTLFDYAPMFYSGGNLYIYQYADESFSQVYTDGTLEVYPFIVLKMPVKGVEFTFAGPQDSIMAVGADGKLYLLVYDLDERESWPSDDDRKVVYFYKTKRVESWDLNVKHVAAGSEKDDEYVYYVAWNDNEIYVIGWSSEDLLDYTKGEGQKAEAKRFSFDNVRDVLVGKQGIYVLSGGKVYVINTVDGPEGVKVSAEVNVGENAQLSLDEGGDYDLVSLYDGKTLKLMVFEDGKLDEDYQAEIKLEGYESVYAYLPSSGVEFVALKGNRAYFYTFDFTYHETTLVGYLDLPVKPVWASGHIDGWDVGVITFWGDDGKYYRLFEVLKTSEGEGTSSGTTGGSEGSGTSGESNESGTSEGETSGEVTFQYHDDFSSLNKEFWYVGEWVTNEPAYGKVRIEDSALVLPVEETDRGPYLLSKAIPIERGDIVVIERRIYVHYGNEYYQGELVFLQTNETELNLPSGKVWHQWPGMMDTFILGHYHYYYGSWAPVQDGFALTAPGWRENGQSVITDPIWDQWFTEKIVYDTETGETTYYLNGVKIGKITAQPLTSDYFRVLIHSYGWYTGHYLKLDWVKIEVTGKESGETGTSEETETSGTETGQETQMSIEDQLKHFLDNAYTVEGLVYSRDGYNYRGVKITPKTGRLYYFPYGKDYTVYLIYEDKVLAISPWGSDDFWEGKTDTPTIDPYSTGTVRPIVLPAEARRYYSISNDDIAMMVDENGKLHILVGLDWHPGEDIGWYTFKSDAVYDFDASGVLIQSFWSNYLFYAWKDNELRIYVYDFDTEYKMWDEGANITVEPRLYSLPGRIREINPYIGDDFIVVLTDEGTYLIPNPVGHYSEDTNVYRIDDRVDLIGAYGYWYLDELLAYSNGQLYGLAPDYSDTKRKMTIEKGPYVSIPDAVGLYGDNCQEEFIALSLSDGTLEVYQHTWNDQKRAYEFALRKTFHLPAPLVRFTFDYRPEWDWIKVLGLGMDGSFYNFEIQGPGEG